MAPSASSSKSASPEPQVVEKKERKRKRSSKAVAEAVVEGAVAGDAPPEAQAVDKKERKRKRKATAEATEPADEDVVMDDARTKDAAEDNDAEADEKPDAEAETGAEPEVPVLSHAERRRQKKEAKLAAARAKAAGADADPDADGEGAAVKKRKLKDGSAKAVDNTTKARQNSVWVGNMSFKTQQDDLRRFFSAVSSEITRINMPTKAPSGPGVRPENRGFAYVDFATVEAKTAAIALSEQPLLGRKLLIKDGDSFEGRPAATAAGELTLADPPLVHKTHSKTAQKILRSQKQPPAPTLFIGNLGFETTEETIRQLFDAHRPGNKKGKNVSKDDAEVKAEEKDDTDAAEAPTKTEEQKPKDDWIRQIRMGTFEDTGLCKGFAFIDFTSVEHSTSALINPKNHHLNGRNLLVEYASPDAVRRGAHKVRPPGERTANQGKKRPHRTERLQARAAQRSGGAPAAEDGEGDVPEDSDAAAAAPEARPKRPWEHKETTTGEGGRHKGPRSRPKPGAALALAKRESVAIVPSEGRKVVF